MVERLHGGLSDSVVYRVTYKGAPAVLKLQKGRRELAFLTEYAPASAQSIGYQWCWVLEITNRTTGFCWSTSRTDGLNTEEIPALQHSQYSGVFTRYR